MSKAPVVTCLEDFYPAVLYYVDEIREFLTRKDAKGLAAAFKGLEALVNKGEPVSEEFLWTVKTHEPSETQHE